MNRRDIRSFARRARAPVAEAKAEYWSMRQRATEGLATFAAGHALFEHVRSLHPDFPGPEGRAEDWTHHLLLKRRIDAAAKAFAVRRTAR